MSRPLRIEYEGAWYHIMSRGRQSEPIFESRDDYVRFIEILKESTELWDIRIGAYCLMTNHYHLLAHTPRGNLSRSMRHINGVYTQRFNRAHGLDGQLFRGRYKSIIVGGDSYLLELVRYIHRNPVRAGVAGKLDDYQWSSHKKYLSAEEKWDWLHKDFILSLLSSEKSTRLKAYKNFMTMEDSEDIVGIFERKKWPIFLADESFANKLKRKYFKEKRNSQVPDSRSLAPSLQLIKKEICVFYGVDESNLLKSRRGWFNEPRNMAVYFCRKMRKDSLIDLSSEFGLSGYSSVSSIVSGTKKQIIKNHQIKKRYKELEKIITISQSET
jgi:putative transposase